jgi:hypothetical protein
LTKEELTVLGIGEWVARHRRPSQPDKAGRANDPIVRLVLKATLVNLEVRKPAQR